MNRIDLSNVGRAPLSRRGLLRGVGVSLALPLLDFMLPTASAAKPSATPRRMLAILTPYGIHAPKFFPQNSGYDYELSPYLKPFGDFRRQLTVFSGVHHPDVDGGHTAEMSFLTAAPHPKGSNFKNTISVDQYAAERIGSATRFRSLSLATLEPRGLSWTPDGVQIPAENSPAQVFAKLFLQGTQAERKTQMEKLRQGRSILDTVRSNANRLRRNVGTQDRDKLDQYFESVRKLEEKLVKSEEWSRKPKPQVAAKQPVDSTDPADLLDRTRLMFDLAHLALETDSTRVITLSITGTFLVPPIQGIAQGHHPLSHHGNDPDKLDQLHRIESEQMIILRDLLTKLRDSREDSETLLDRTMVLYGSNLGNANNHDTNNMPMLLAGGGFKHGQHLAFDRENNYPLPNLFVSMLQRLGIETDRFASSTGTMRGLEFAG